MIGKGFYWVNYQGKIQVAFHENGRWSICGSVGIYLDADMEQIFETYLDGQRIEIGKSTPAEQAAVDRAVKAERLLREQTSAKYQGEILCLLCHKIGTVRVWMKCKDHNPELLAASPENPQP